MKTLKLAVLILFIPFLTIAQALELVQNGSFTNECGPGYEDPPCGWNYRQGDGSDDISWDIPAHVGKGNLKGYYYESLGTCNGVEIARCNGKTIISVQDNECPPLSLTPSIDNFGDPIFVPTTSSCAMSKDIFGQTNGGTSSNKHCLFLPPGFGSFNRKGVETNVGKLCAGDYKLSFDVMIMLPSENSAFALQAFLNNTQNDKDKEIFKLLDSEGNKMSPGVWKHFEIDVTIDKEENNKFEWLSFVNERCKAGLISGPIHSVFIDNVSFYSKCTKREGACSPYLGKPNPVWVYTKNSQTICVTNLHNIKHCKLEIINDWGQILRTIEIDDPANKICWDEKTYSGNVVGAMHLTARLTAETGCCTTTKSYGFTRIVNEVVHNGDFTDYSPQVKLDGTNCCNPDIVIENEVISDMRQYIGPVKIRIGPNVTIKNTADVYLQAGVNIDIVEPFKTEAGANFKAKIQKCSSPKFKVSPQTIINAINDSIFQPEEELAKNDNWYLMPNPARDKVSIDLSLMSLQYPNVQLVIYDFMNKEIVSKQIFEGLSKHTINITNLTNGIYFISLKQDGQVLSTKRFLKH